MASQRTNIVKSIISKQTFEFKCDSGVLTRSKAKEQYSHFILKVKKLEILQNKTLKSSIDDDDNLKLVLKFREKMYQSESSIKFGRNQSSLTMNESQ